MHKTILWISKSKEECFVMFVMGRVLNKEKKL